MNALEVSLDWFKDTKGYRIDDYGKYGIWIIGNGGKLAPNRPLDNDAAFLAFKKLEAPQDLLAFVHHYGHLERPSYVAQSGRAAVDEIFFPMPGRRIIYGEDVDLQLETASKFRELLKWISRKGRASESLSGWIEDRILGPKLGELSFELKSGGFKMSLKAETLIDGLLIQLARKMSGGSKFQVCSLCGNPFEVGPGAKRRSDAMFCCREHKIEFHSRKRSKSS
ncbi:hypothetical protein [Tardiphaga sp.]|uniref:hypothetical protein n=1 Tax=Tardiphaga sp. TaxID=1926292 RepID=UPI0026231D73|nr:hypothetical protein [Tardiphaga sp.]MDB5617824.1 hypothetical protein [Tardiphaga sp.]